MRPRLGWTVHSSFQLALFLTGCRKGLLVQFVKGSIIANCPSSHNQYQRPFKYKPSSCTFFTTFHSELRNVRNNLFFNVNESSFTNAWLPMIVSTVKHGFIWKCSICIAITEVLGSDVIARDSFVVRGLLSYS